MGRFSHSWDLTKTSYRVLMQDKELLWMPVLATLASIAAILAVAGIGVAGGLFPEVTTNSGLRPVGALLAFTMYVLLAFVSLFFNAAVVAGATERMKGGNPTVGSALRAAAGKAGKLFLWAIVVATVNVILQALREVVSRDRSMVSRILSEILISIGASLWNLATAFMVPVLLFEDKGIGQSLKSSVSVVKRHWGETVIANVGLGLAQFVVMLAIGLAAFLFIYLSAGVSMVLTLGVIVVAVLALALVAAFFSVLGGVYRAALYRFATTNQAPAGFSAQQLGGAFWNTQRPSQ